MCNRARFRGCGRGAFRLGRITLLVGRPGEGKSFLTTDAAARITTGTPWPDGKHCPKGSVILISAEDDPADTIRPRLDAHCADVRHVHLLSAVRRVDGDGQYERLITLADVDAIEAALMRLSDCKLIVVDPIGSFLGGGTDAHRDNEVRGVLAPIAAMAEKHGPAVLVVAHRRKVRPAWPMTSPWEAGHLPALRGPSGTSHATTKTRRVGCYCPARTTWPAKATAWRFRSSASRRAFPGSATP